MLVQFKFKNYGPFRDEMVFDMRAIKSYKEHPENIVDGVGGNSYLKVAAIYGANASGKSNFVGAYKTFLRIVQESFAKNGKEEHKNVLEEYYDPFLFDNHCENGDIEFEATFHEDSFEYRYGFVFNSKRVEFEWLYRTNIESKRKAATTIFEREANNIVLGASVRKECEKYIQDIDEDVMALSFFSSLRLKSSVFKDTIDCITSILPIRMTCMEFVEHAMERYFKYDYDEEEKTEFLSFLKAIDIQIKDVEVKKNSNSIEIYTYHSMPDGSLRRVPIGIESDGTKKAIAIYSYIRIAVLGNLGIIIDELNMQLHPLLVKYLIELFYEQSTSGQLIYTTHDTTLLDKKYVRRDQVWFAEKDEAGASSLYSLAEYKIRNDYSFEKAYLGGAFGGIPNLTDFFFEKESSDGDR